MPPFVALFLWLILLVVLLTNDPAREPRPSLALWVPLIWMFIAGSRNFSQWLSGPVTLSAESLEEGSPVDQVVTTALILLAIGILYSRSFRWSEFMTRNSALMAFLLFALLSASWSDFPLIALKRWCKDLGNYAVVLVVLSDARPLAAMRSLLRRLSYLLVPLSIVLIKYFPALSNQYDYWTGAQAIGGAGTNKNMLGVICLVSGLFFFWDTATRWTERRQQRTKRIIAVNIVFMCMTLWLLNLAHSTTSSVCLAVGCLVIVAAQSKVFKSNPRVLMALILSFLCLYVVLAFGFDMNGKMAAAVGKDPTLTDRTKIWAALLSMHTNPLIGTGYQCFWLGPRLEWFWQNAHLGHINEAHNGYLEIYLNLGLIGDFLFVAFLLAGYRAIFTSRNRSFSLATLALAVWTIAVFYDMSEAAFRGGLLWMMLLLANIAMPARVKKRIEDTSRLDGEVVTARCSVPTYSATGAPVAG